MTPQMTSAQRALQYWSVLVFAAREQKVVSYEMLAQMTGMANEAGHPLGYILYYCQQHDLPLLNLLAVNKKTGRPNDRCGVSLEDLPAQQSRVYIYDWLTHGAPSIDELIQARENAEKSKAALAAP